MPDSSSTRRGHRLFSVPVLVLLALCFLPVAAQPAVEECDNPGDALSQWMCELTINW
jgi:hypothetical protein